MNRLRAKELAMNTYRRILRGAEQTCPYWVALEDEKCTGERFHRLRDFCDERFLSLSRHGHSVMRENQHYQVFMFAEEKHAEVFCKQFGGERMQPSQRGRGTHWAQWNKGAHKSG